MTNQPLPSVGEQLRLARESRKLSLEQAAYQTHIRLRYLTALETDDLSIFPSTAQARGFLRTYAGLLGLEADGLAALVDGKTPAPSADPLSVSVPPDEPAPEGDETPTTPAGDASFIIIGQKLRSQRELLGLSIEDVERHSHIRSHYLQALETGRVDDLPSPVQGRGMLTNYATFLSLDPDALLLRYAEGLQARLSMRRRLMRPAKPSRPASDPSAPRRRLPFDLILGGGVVVALLFFLVWGAAHISSMVAQVTPEAEAPSIANILAEDRTPTPVTLVEPVETNELAETGVITETAATPTLQAPIEGIAPPTEAALISTPSNALVQVYIVALGRSWMRITVDGKVEFEGRTMAGSNYPYAGNESIELKVGNGAAIKVIYNRTDLGVLGSLGEIVERVFTVSGIQLPTPTVTPTPLPATATPVTTPTLTPAP